MWKNLTKLARIENSSRVLNAQDYCNPDSSSTCLILWVLSTNPLYFELINECIRSGRKDMIDMFGPVILVLYWTTQYLEEYKVNNVELGKD